MFPVEIVNRQIMARLDSLEVSISNILLVGDYRIKPINNRLEAAKFWLRRPISYKQICIFGSKPLSFSISTLLIKLKISF